MNYLVTAHSSFLSFDLQSNKFYHGTRRDDFIEVVFPNENIVLMHDGNYIAPSLNGTFTLAMEPFQFDFIRHPDGAISLSHKGRFLSARKDGSFSFVDKVLAWEKFQLKSESSVTNSPIPASKKIGVFGYYSNDNFGGQLTVIAAYTLLSNIGYEPLVFRLKNHNNNPALLYNKKLEFTKGSIDSSSSRNYWGSYFDAFVLCSDWTLHKTWIRSPGIRLFEWTKPEKTRIALGSSFGTGTGKWTEVDYPYLNQLLARFQHLGIREAEGVELCHKIGIPHACQLPDPIFALPRKFYEEIAHEQPHKEIADAYAAIYLLDMNLEDIKTAVEICAKLKLQPLFLIAIKDKKATENLGHPHVYDVMHGVSTWLYYLLHASYVVTNSFHGICLSFIFNKEFVYIPRNIFGCLREKYLLRDFGLLDKMAADAQSINKALAIKTTSNPDIKNKLEQYRRRIIKFAQNALEKQPELSPTANKTVATLPRQKCTGCLACGHVCPRHCISVTRDVLTGFAYPVIDAAKCVSCGICYNVCPILSPKNISHKNPKNVFCGYSLNEKMRFNSTSGGFFGEIAQKFIENHKAVIFGAIYETPYTVRHGYIENVDQIKTLRQSKYVQSDLAVILPELKNILQKGRTAVFCGTPCQCAAVHNYLDFFKINTGNLFLIDFICHSVNSPTAYKAYLTAIAAAHNDAIKSVWFKNKEKSWNNFSTRIDFVSSEKYYISDRYTDPFYKGFLQYRLFSRDCCHDCQFKGISRNVDITLADAWGIKIRENDRNGVSTAIIHSQKGQKIFQSILDRLYTEEKTIEEVSRGNVNLTRSTPEGEFSKFFWEKMAQKEPFSQIINEIGEMAKDVNFKKISMVDAKKQTFAIPDNVHLNGAVIRAHPTARITVKNGCTLYLNWDRFEGSHNDCLLDLKEGANLIVDGNFKIYHSCRIQIHKNAVLRLGAGYLNTNGIIVCQKSVDIGDAIIAPNAYIVDSDYHAIYVDDKVINAAAPVKFEGHVWLGQNVTVLKGVTIGSGSVIGAKSLVNRNIPAQSLAVGNPARVIRSNITWR